MFGRFVRVFALIFCAPCLIFNITYIFIFELYDFSIDLNRISRGEHNFDILAHNIGDLNLPYQHIYRSIF